MERINVKDYGAVGDGFTDDTDALQEALSAGGGKEVFFPKGRYLVRPDASLYVRRFTTLLGEGPDKTIISSDGLHGYCMQYTDDTSVVGLNLENARLVRLL